MELNKYYEKVLLENPVLPINEERELLEKYQRNSDADEKNRIAKRLADSHLRLVLRYVGRCCVRFPWMNSYLEEFIEEGNRGLIRAIEKYELGRGKKLSTYANWWIKQKIYRLLKKFLKNGERNISLDEPINHDDGSTFGEIIPDPNQEQHPERRSDYSPLLIAVNELPEREREIIYGRFGLNNHTPQRLEDLSLTFGRTRERIRQIQNKALIKLRKKLRGSFL